MSVSHSPFAIRHLSFPAPLAALGGFLLSWQTVWILRPGMLGGVPWPLATIGVYASDAVLLVAAVIGVMRAWRSGALPPTPPLHGGGETKTLSPLPTGRGSERGWRARRRVFVALAVLVVAAAVNTWVSADPWLSAVGWLRIIAFLLALAGLPYSERATRALLGGFLVAMLGHVALGLWQFMTLEAQPSTLLGIAGHSAWTLGDSVITAPGERWLRAYGGFPHPNVFGTALLVGLFSLLVISAPKAHPPLAETVPWNGEISGRSGISRLHFVSLEMTMWAVSVFALVVSFSRAALLGFVVLLIVLARKAATRRLAVAGTLAMVAAMAITWPFWTPRFTGSTPNEQRSIVERATVVRGALTILPNALVSRGHGLHALPAQMYQWYGDRDLRLVQPIHNVPFLALIELGGIGALVLVLVLVSLLRHPLFIIHNSLFFLVLLPTFLFDHHLWSLPIGLALVFALAVAASCRASPAGDSA